METNAPKRSLIEAIKADDVELMQDCIIAGADIQIKDNLDHTLLHFACKVGSPNVAEALIRYQLDVNDEDIKGATPLHFACASGNTEMVELLLNNKANLRAKDMNGWTPLHWASAKGELEIAKRLIQAGASIRAVNSAHATAVDLDTTGALREFVSQQNIATPPQPEEPNIAPSFAQW